MKEMNKRLMNFLLFLNSLTSTVGHTTLITSNSKLFQSLSLVRNSKLFESVAKTGVLANHHMWNPVRSHSNLATACRLANQNELRVGDHYKAR